MSLEAYLDALPFHDIVRRPAGNPADSVIFTGVPRKHPYDPEKIMLFGDPLGDTPQMTEFKLSDIVLAEQLPSPVTQDGEGLNMVKVWVRRGSIGMQYQPFEVEAPLRFMKDSKDLRDRFLQSLST
jgi:hypothetical protein